MACLNQHLNEPADVFRREEEDFRCECGLRTQEFLSKAASVEISATIKFVNTVDYSVFQQQLNVWCHEFDIWLPRPVLEGCDVPDL